LRYSAIGNETSTRLEQGNIEELDEGSEFHGEGARKGGTRLDFEAVSFRNIVDFYREELLQIDEGRSASKVLSHKQCKSMRKYGVLTFKTKCRGRQYRLTERAREVLRLLKAQ